MLLRAGRVEAAVEDAVAGLKLAQQALERLRRRLGPRGQGVGPRFPECVPQRPQVGRVLAHEQLDGKGEGVEGAREGAQLGLVELQPQHLADRDPFPVEAHDHLLLHMGEEEAEGQGQGRLLRAGLHLSLRVRGSRAHECRRSHGVFSLC